MIGYAPFEPDDPVEVVPTPRKREVVSNDFVNGGNNRKIHHQRVMRDDTECNYLVTVSYTHLTLPTNREV